jgi:ubiquinone/menaquinone biosynthesis C-methylase UbiE
MHRDEHQRAALANWKSMAPGWERRRADIESVSSPVTEWLVQALAPQPDDVVLELAAGPGDTGFAAAPLLGDDGRLISTDFSSEMLDIARRRAAELGLTNVDHRVMDAQVMDLADDSVDGVLCRFGYMLMLDQEAAFAETRRVLRPGGRLALAVWREPQRNPWVAIAGRLLTERGLVPPPDPDAPTMFGMASDERMRELLEGAGFEIERLEDVPVTFRYDTVDDYVASARETGGMFARAWAGMSEDARRELTAALAQAFAPFAVDGGYALPGVAFCAAASKPDIKHGNHR